MEAAHAHSRSLTVQNVTLRYGSRLQCKLENLSTPERAGRQQGRQKGILWKFSVYLYFCPLHLHVNPCPILKCLLALG